MKEGVLDILIYLFENYMDDAEPYPRPDRALLTEELEHAGFEGADINRALQWLDGLRETPDSESERATARTILVINRPDGTPEFFDLELTWKGYAKTQRLHLLDHRSQITKLRAQQERPA